MAENQSQRGQNTIGLPGRKYQDLDTGLVYTDEGEHVAKSDKSDVPVIQKDRIGIFERVVHADGTVSTYQVDDPTRHDEIQTPVPLPGEKQDQAGTGQTADVKSTSATSKASVKK